MKILIIDNSVFFREKLKKDISSKDISIFILEELTYECAKLAILNHNPDLIILDIDLNGKSWIKLIKEIELSSPNCNVIVFTNYSSEEFKTNCLENGADYFFDKGKNYIELLEVIRCLIKQHVMQ